MLDRLRRLAASRPAVLAGAGLLVALGLGLAAVLARPAGPAPSPASPPPSGPRVAYLAPASQSPQNIWIADVAAPQIARQLTFSAGGVFNFDISPDGMWVAYAEHNPDNGGIDLMLLAVAGGEPRLLLACPGAECTTPAWSPDGTRIAYERLEESTDEHLGDRPTRVWLLTLSEEGITADRPLFNDPHTLCSGPVWAPDGSRIAVYATHAGGILIQTLGTEEALFIPSLHGGSGAFSPDGTRLVYPDLAVAEGTSRTRLNLADLTTGAVTPLYDAALPVDDERAVWSADGQTLIVARRYLDDRYTPGRQLYRIAATTGDSKPLLVDPAYYHGYFEPDPAGVQLVIQRLAQPGGDPTRNSSTPEIWVYNTGDATLAPIATDAFLPQWIP